MEPEPRTPQPDGHWLPAMVVLVGIVAVLAIILDGVAAGWVIDGVVVALVAAALILVSHRR